MTSSGATAPRRQASGSAWRRLSSTVLVIGTLLALAAVWGPSWVVRAGLVVAVLSAVLSCGLAWRELADARRAHAAETLAAARASGAVLREERRHNAGVVDALADRARTAAAEIQRLRSGSAELTRTIGLLRGQVAGLERARAESAADARERDALVASLTGQLRAREAELAELSAQAAQAAEAAQPDPGTGDEWAEVRSIPRRVRTEQEPAGPRVPAADELWPDGRHPSVAGLVDASVVLPNYEGERRPA